VVSAVADLVELDDFKDFLGITDSAQDDLLSVILDGLEDLFESECGRRSRPFSDALVGRVEVLDGTGTAKLFLDYPIAALTSIALGADPSEPDETLDPTDFEVVAWTVGRLCIRRVDGCTWGCRGVPNIVRVTYDTQADLPTTAAIAVRRVAATVYRQLGAEDLKSERTSTFSRDLAKAAEEDPIWCMAMRGERVVRV